MTGSGKKERSTVLRNLSAWACVVALSSGLIFMGYAVTAQAADAITVAVIPLDFRSSSQWSGVDVGRQITALITDKLVETGGFAVVERERIDAILDEQKFGASGLVDPSRAAEIGRLLGADVLVFGTVTKFEFSSSGGLSFGGVSLSGTNAKVDVTGRVVDSSLGVIHGSAEGNGSSTGAGISVRNLEGLSFQASQFQSSSLGKATVQAVDNFVENIAATIEKNADAIRGAKERGNLRGAVVAVIDNGVVVGIGSAHGVRKEQRFSVFRLMEIAGLSEPVRIPVGVVRMISVDEHASVGVFESTSQPVQIGDVVSPE